jgi:hypothetical protein
MMLFIPLSLRRRSPCGARRQSQSGSRLSLALLFMTFCIIVTVAPVGAQVTFFTQEPAGADATLVDINQQQILDTTFASWIQSALIKNGMSNAQDAKFFFQECFGGGMLTPLQTDLGNLVPWVGGSASRWDQEAWPTPNGNNGAWTAALIPQLNNLNQTILTDLNNARATDVQGINGTGMEEGQSIVANGGQNITLQDATAQSHHAILWVGDTQYSGGNPFVTAIGQMINTLQNAWQGTNYTINVLFGDGQHDTLGNPLPASWHAQAATAANLQATIAAVGQQMNPNEQFLFYGFDHGGQTLPVQPPGNANYPIVIAPNQTVNFLLLLTQVQLLGLVDNGVISVPQLVIDWTNIGGIQLGDIDVYLVNANGQFFLGDFGPDAGDNEPGDPMSSFSIPVNLLTTSNTLEFINEPGATFQVNSVGFQTGAVFPRVVPEPTAWLAPAMGSLSLLLLTRRRRIR